MFQARVTSLKLLSSYLHNCTATRLPQTVTKLIFSKTRPRKEKLYSTFSIHFWTWNQPLPFLSLHTFTLILSTRPDPGSVAPVQLRISLVICNYFFLTFLENILCIPQMAYRFRTRRSRAEMAECLRYPVKRYRKHCQIHGLRITTESRILPTEKASWMRRPHNSADTFTVDT